MLHTSLTNGLTRRINARVAGLEKIVVQHGLLPDLVAIAAGIALAILALLFWSVGHFSGLTLPGWYWVLGYLGMTAATYAQFAQRREQREAGERDRG